jgi:hypothetical protein
MLSAPRRAARALGVGALLLLLVAITAGSATAQRPGSKVAKRLVVDRAVVSPDREHVAYLTHLFPRDLPVESIRVKTVGGPTRVLYRSSDSCCSRLAWLSPTRLVFDDDYRVTTLDVTTGRIQRIAGFSDFAISPDHKSIAGWADSGGHLAQTVYVVSADGSTCRVVPTPSRDTDVDAYFSHDGALHVLRYPFTGGLGVSTTGHWVRLTLAHVPLTSRTSCSQS